MTVSFACCLRLETRSQPRTSGARTHHCSNPACGVHTVLMARGLAPRRCSCIAISQKRCWLCASLSAAAGRRPSVRNELRSSKKKTLFPKRLHLSPVSVDAATRRPRLTNYCCGPVQSPSRPRRVVRSSACPRGSSWCRRLDCRCWTCGHRHGRTAHLGPTLRSSRMAPRCPSVTYYDRGGRCLSYSGPRSSPSESLQGNMISTA